MASRPIDSDVKKTALKIIVLGDSGVGKSTVVNILLLGEHNPNLKATVGVDVFHKDITVNNRPYILELRDVAGQERYRSICPSYYRDCDACILVFDLDNYVSYTSVPRWHHDILQHVHSNTEHSWFPFIVVGNKRDLVVEGTPKVPAADVQRWCASHEIAIPYLETSYKDIRSVEEVMDVTLAGACLYNHQHNPCYGTGLGPLKVKLESSESEPSGRNCAGCFR